MERGGIAAEGRVVRLASRGCFVEAPDGSVIRCELRGSVKAGRRERTHPVAAGDRVVFTVTGPGEGVLEEVLPRDTVFSRSSPGRPYEQVIAANADAVLAITSSAMPPFRPGLVDRVLTAADIGGLEGWVCLNKVDLETEEEFRGEIQGFERAGYRVFETSALTGRGVDSLELSLKGRTVVLVGHSGVGKSSLIGRIRPDLDLPVNAVSERTGKGVHTTTAAQMLRLSPDSLVIDTPGIREFLPFGIEPGNLWRHYPEMAGIGGACRYRNCLHSGEDGCAVLAAVGGGEIHGGRYRRYLKFLRSLQEGRRGEDVR